MQRKLYIPVFMLLAATFVPVVLDFGVVGFVVPSGWIAASVTSAVFRMEWAEAACFLAYLAVYLLLFYAPACFTFWLSALLNARALRITVQTFFFAMLFACSFLRVITYSSIRGGGGAYTFWAAAHRAIERKEIR